MVADHDQGRCPGHDGRQCGRGGYGLDRQGRCRYRVTRGHQADAVHQQLPRQRGSEGGEGSGKGTCC